VETPSDFHKERKKEQKRKKGNRLVETAATVEIRLNNARISTVAWIRRAKNVLALSTVTTSLAAINQKGEPGIRTPKTLTQETPLTQNRGHYLQTSALNFPDHALICKLRRLTSRIMLRSANFGA
jgi:hypothetical protein